ncbi:hypothetical protein BDN70DRAFT_895777 [Pholiota conissans]|uniref:Uncharacterized protein n=1 Tax=Pholiota conissans TaxID=109636 RepID=A0A9P5Z243_9AGAR|nr:hypothetical protein BDN70DRAFT_895777 [Pholiota conissans]
MFECEPQYLLSSVATKALLLKAATKKQGLHAWTCGREVIQENGVDTHTALNVGQDNRKELFDIGGVKIIQETNCVVKKTKHILRFSCIYESNHSKTLIPIRREPRNVERASYVDSLLPRSSVILDYGYDAHGPTHASVLVEAHEDRPILLLEALSPSLLQSVACESDTHSSSIILTLHSEEVVRETTREWTENGYPSFNVITAHFGCNAGNERGAWSVSSARTDAQKIILFVSPMQIQDVGKTFDISVRHSALGSRWASGGDLHQRRASGRLGRRDFEGTNTATLTNNISGTQIFPGNSSALGLASDTIQYIFQIDLTGASLEITCTECTSNFNFTTGVDFTFTPGVVGISKATLFAAVLEFDQSVVLDISVGKTLEKDFQFDLIKIPVDGFEVPNLFAVGPFIGISAEFNFSITASVDFIVGANTSIPAQANATMDLITPGNSVATGWDGVTFKTSPIRINSGAPNFTIGGVLAPFIEFDINVGAGKNNTGLTARLTQTTPAIELELFSVNNVNSACMPAGDNDFSLFGTAYTVQGTVGLLTTADVQVNDAGLLESVGLDASPSWSATLFQRNFNIFGGTPDANQTCFVVADDGGADKSPAAAPTATAPTSSQHPAATGTLLSAPSAIPTYNISKIQTYFDSHNNTLPPGITFQMLAGSGQQLPDSLKPSGTSGSGTSSNGANTGSALRSSVAKGYFAAVVWMLILSLAA